MDELKRAISEDPEAVLQIVRELNDEELCEEEPSLETKPKPKKIKKAKKKITMIEDASDEQPKPPPQPAPQPPPQPTINSEMFERLLKKMEDMEVKMNSQRERKKKEPKPEPEEPKRKAKGKKNIKVETEDKPKPRIKHKAKPTPNHGKNEYVEEMKEDVKEEATEHVKTAPEVKESKKFPSVFADEY